MGLAETIPQGEPGHFRQAPEFDKSRIPFRYSMILPGVRIAVIFSKAL